MSVRVHFPAQARAILNRHPRQGRVEPLRRCLLESIFLQCLSVSDSGRLTNALRSSEAQMLSGHVVVDNPLLGVDSNCVHVEFLEGLKARFQHLRLGMICVPVCLSFRPPAFLCVCLSACLSACVLVLLSSIMFVGRDVTDSSLHFC